MDGRNTAISAVSAVSIPPTAMAAGSADMGTRIRRLVRGFAGIAPRRHAAKGGRADAEGIGRERQDIGEPAQPVDPRP